MSASVFGAAAAVTMLNRAFNNASPANAVFNNQVATAGTTDASQFAFATTFAQGFASLSNADLASRVMGNLGMLPNDALLAAFTDYLAANGVESRGVIVLQLSQILSTMENATGDLAIYAPQAVAWNKEVEQSFIYSSNTASTTAYNGDFAPTPVDQGQTFTLTNSVDNIAGTGGNDIIIAGEQAGTATLNAGDQINGGAGTDTMKIFAGAANFGSTTVSNVEVIEVHEDASLNVAGNTGVKEAWSIGGIAKTITANLTQIVGFGNQASATAEVAVFAGAGGTTDAATVALKDAGKTVAFTTGLTVADIESLTLKVSGTNQIGTLTAVNAAKLTITGDGSLTATLSDDTAYKTIDASAATGKMDITAAGAANSLQVLDIKTGTADDTYTTLFVNLTKDDKIDLGGGSDTLAFAGATDLSDATKAAVLGGVTNVEKLAVGGGAFAFAVDGDSLAQTVFVHNSTGAFTGTTFGSGDTMVVGAVNIADSTVAMKLGQNTFNLALVGTKTAKSDASKITVTGASNVKVDSSGSVEQAAANVLNLETDDNGIVTLTGAKDLTATFLNNGGTTGLSIDGSAFTGKLDVTGTANADIIKGGSGADTFNVFGSGVDEVTGGAGKDKFVVFGADADVLVGAIAVTDIITDFVSGTDTLSGFGTAGSATNYKEATAVSATLAAFLGDADTALNATVKYYVGQVGSDTYVAYDDDGIGFTSVVKLTGVALDGIAQADIVA